VSTLTAGADLAWKLAAAEAVAGGHPLIENAQLFVGVLSLTSPGAGEASLEKAEDAPAERALAPEVRRAVEDEGRQIREVLERCALAAGSLRRLLREHAAHGGLAAHGGYDHHGAVVSRSPSCKETFYRAAMLSGPGGVSALDLLAALAGASDPPLARAVREAGGSLERLREEARSAARAVRAGGPPAAAGGAAAEAAHRETTPHLDRYGRDLTALAARGELGPVIGRRAELLQVLQTLARASKNNPVLAGEPGVGKTAIVEALAQRAAQGKDPAVLGGRRIVELRLTALLAGTKYRGALEERVANVLAEVRAHPEVIVFIDELHAVVGAGETAAGGGDAADLLKPALARGDFRLIGATTLAKYRRHIESDPALECRFERIVVNEATPEEALEILEGLRPRWEDHHRVRIDDAALRAAVDLSVRFDPDHCLPDKAIDLLDKAVARTRVAALSRVRPEGPAEGARGEALDPVTERTVAQVLAEKAQLPMELVAEGLPGPPRPPVLEVEAFLRERLVGQDEAIARVARRLRIAHAGTHESERPLATLLLMGPPGVGKAETARLAASFLFGTEKALHRFDMSEYMEEHSVARLMGSPPGYVGHELEGRLVSRLRTIPHAVVLLAEAEKAHPSVLDVFLKVFDAGRLTDGKGRTADARHAVFILTSNLGSEEFFRPDFLNRIDEVIAFRALGLEDAVRILRSRLRALCDTVQRQHGASLEVEPEAEAFIARTGFDPACGVRELRRSMERLLEAPLSSLILDGKIRKHAVWRVSYDEGGIYVVPRT
jgi:ATP-dependent Clp protease ATP-binding subunit ClpC